ncbi:MAG: hypothetical protein HQK76_07350 [Desulfobacterales bacterium]|nr:hypothetical protein [Desulfobacterales bacterium]
MNTAIFESKLLSDGHLYCPKEFAQKKNALFKVIVIFEETEASEHDIELSAINDNSTDFLSKEELSYYLSLEEL